MDADVGTMDLLLVVLRSAVVAFVVSFTLTTLAIMLLRRTRGAERDEHDATAELEPVRGPRSRPPEGR